MADLTTKEYATLGDEQRSQAFVDALRALEDAKHTVARYKAAEAALLVRKDFPDARWVGFEQGHDGIDASTQIHYVYGDGEQAVLFDLEADEDGEYPDTSAEDYLTGASEAGLSFKEQGGLLWLDVIDVA